MADMQVYADYLVGWLEQQRQTFYQMDEYVIGVSGGVDSAVVAHLLARTGAPVKAYLLPSSVSADQDATHAELVLESAGLTGQVISIAPVVKALMTQLEGNLHPDPARVNVLHGNMQARARMLMLYTLAQSYRAIVVGTDNAVEWHTGYFTKFGDGAADVMPLARLRKEQVYELAEVLNVPAVVINKAPSAGLWAGQTDEAEMGVTYADLDAYLRGEAVGEPAQTQIDFWHQRSHHKRQLPLMPDTPQQH